MIAGNQLFQKYANIALVMKTIQQSGQISRIDLANTLGLKKSTVTNIIGVLLEAGVVESLSEGKSSPLGGRRPIAMGLNNKFACVAGIDLQSDVYRFVIADIAGNILYREENNIKNPQNDFLEKLSWVYKKVKHEAVKSGLPLISIGLGISGLIDVKNNTIIRSWMHNIENFDFRNTIQSIIPLPVVIDNDSNCCAWGELWNNNDAKCFIYLQPKLRKGSFVSSRGIGMGIVLDREVYYGPQYSAGEFKSVFWKDENPAQLGMLPEELKRVESDRKVLENYIIEIFVNFSTIVSVLNPEKIIIGGSLQQEKGLVNKLLENELKHSWIAAPNNGCNIEFAKHGDFEVASGAAGMVLSRLFSIPQVGKMRQIPNWETVLKDLGITV